MRTRFRCAWCDDDRVLDPAAHLRDKHGTPATPSNVRALFALVCVGPKRVERRPGPVRKQAEQLPFGDDE